MRPRPGDRLPVRATEIDLEGRGVAEVGGEEVHVEELLPGEQAEVEIRHVSRQVRRSFAVPVAPPATPSPDRTARLCPEDTRCGGCAWQELAYPAQLEHKRRRVARALAAALPAPPPVAEVVPSPVLAGYRNKATYVLAGAPGAVRLGAYAPRSHAWTDTSACRVVVPAIQRAVPRIAGALSRTGLAPFDERTRAGELRYAVARASRAGEVLLGLVTTSAAPRAPLQVAARELASQGGVAGVVWVKNDATSGAILPAAAVVEPLAGPASIAETVSGVTVEVAIDTFVQIHLDQAEALYRRLAEVSGAGAGTRAIDLYCGVGAIAFALAARGAEVTGVERNPAAIAAARAAAERAGLADRARFVAAPADEGDLMAGGEPPDLLVVNPPRQGLTAAVRARIAEARPPIVAYVSCGPDSLARDLAELTAASYAVERVEPFDLMPGTGHVETLVILRRAPAPRRPRAPKIIG